MSENVPPEPMPASESAIICEPPVSDAIMLPTVAIARAMGMSMESTACSAGRNTLDHALAA